MGAPKRIEIVGVPMDLGANRRGVDMGPSAVRYARLEEQLRGMGFEIVDRGNLSVPDRAARSQEAERARYVAIVREVCDELASTVADIVESGGFPLVLGGDHSIAMGTLAGIARARGAAPGLVWVDAHADINSPDTSPSGNVHGMPLHFALDTGSVIPDATVLLGLRDVDPPEKETIRALGVRTYTMSEIDRHGIDAVAREAIEVAAGDGRTIHLSFDMDAIDPREAPGVGTPVKGGLTYREAHQLLEQIAASGRLGSLEITEINPILDVHNQTATLAVELILSALGKTIL
ncbi:MAG: arginase [Candidatus Eremiobacteraeota bacterium]|nr:arginase [Candidatus Eremiobacteraeota bacterium]